MCELRDLDDFEAYAARLEASGDYRILRRLISRKEFNLSLADDLKVAIVLDVETTGLDTEHDEIFEIGMVKLLYSPEGSISKVIGEYVGRREPSLPIPARVARITGVDAEDLRGRAIDASEIVKFIDDAVLVIAHNAAFDRPFCERLVPEFSSKAWACSMTEIDWIDCGFDGRSLTAILSGYRLFHEGHRAIEDCHALTEILSRRLPVTGKLALGQLLATARRVTLRLWAEGAPYEKKDALRSRGYKWADGLDGGRRSWWVEIPEEDYSSEIEFLRSTVDPTRDN